MTTASMNFTTDSRTKERFNKIADKLGLSSSALLNLFVTRVAREGGIPFALKVVPEKNIDNIDEESRKEMIRVLAEENGILPDTDQEVKNLDDYFKKLGM